MVVYIIKLIRHNATHYDGRRRALPDPDDYTLSQNAQLLTRNLCAALHKNDPFFCAFVTLTSMFIHPLAQPVTLAKHMPLIPLAFLFAFAYAGTLFDNANPMPLRACVLLCASFIFPYKNPCVFLYLRNRFQICLFLSFFD